MRRCFLLLLSVWITAAFCLTPVYASEEAGNDFLQELTEAAGADELREAVPEDAREMLEKAEMDIFSAQSLLLQPKQLIRIIWDELREQATKPLKALGTVLGTILICALLDCVDEAFTDKSLKQVLAGVTVLFLTISVIVPSADCIRDCGKDLSTCASFISVYAPIYASVITASGMPVTGNLYQILVFSAAQIVAALVSAYLVPLAGVFLALSIAGTISPQLQLAPMLNTLKSVVCWSLGFLLAGFVTLLTMQCSLSSGMDALTLKTSKMLISSFVPIVGGALSEAVSAAGGCLRILRSVFGVYGIAAAVCIFLPSLLRTGMWYFLMNVGASVGEMLSVKAAAGLLKAGGSLMGILIAVQCLYLLLILVSTTILMLAGSGIA